MMRIADYKSTNRSLFLPYHEFFSYTSERWEQLMRVLFLSALNLFECLIRPPFAAQLSRTAGEFPEDFSADIPP